jgi:hypothetical protein
MDIEFKMIAKPRWMVVPAALALIAAIFFTGDTTDVLENTGVTSDTETEIVLVTPAPTDDEPGVTTVVIVDGTQQDQVDLTGLLKLRTALSLNPDTEQAVILAALNDVIADIRTMTE